MTSLMEKIVKGGLIIWIIFLNLTLSYSQNNTSLTDQEISTQQIDSLLYVLSKTKTDTSKIHVLEQLGEIYSNENYEKGMLYCEQGLTLSKKINYLPGQANCQFLIGILNDNKGNYDIATEYYIKSAELFHQLGLKEKEAICYSYIGIVYYYQGKHVKSLSFHEKSLALNKEINNKSGIPYCYINIGNIYLDLGDYSKAIENFQTGEKIAEKIYDKKIIAACNANIGGIYYYMQSFDKSLEYYLKALKLCEELGDKKGKANVLNNIGNIYNGENNFQKALEYFRESLKIREEINDLQGTASSLNNIGNANNGLNNFEKANEYFLKSLKIYELLGDSGWISVVYLNISDLYIKQNKFRLAQEYSQKSLDIANKIGELQTVSLAYENLSKSYKGMGNFQEALENYQLFKQINDSLFNSDKHKQIVQMEAIYQSEKKQKEIELKESQLAKKEIEVKQEKTIKIAFIVGFLFMLFLSGIILKSYRDKRKANLKLSQQNEEISAQRDEREAQRDLVELQKQQIEEIYKHVTDSIGYAKLIQEAVLPKSDLTRLILDEHFVFFKPKDIVSGDFYWTVKIKNILFVAVADCTGHGVPGAFMSMLGISFLNEIVQKQDIKMPGKVLNQLRLEIINALQQKGIQGEQKDGLDISLFVINKDTNECQWAGANNPLYVIARSETSKQSLKEIASLSVRDDDEELIELKGNKMPIAIYPEMKDFTNHEFTLQKGDSVYLFTDGYADQFGGPNGRKFMYKQIKEILIHNSSKPMQEQREILETTFSNWKSGYEQIDDVTLIGMRI